MVEALKFTIVDAFTDRPFGGNPAAVIVLPSDKTYTDSVLQGIALELNLSETAFICPPKEPSLMDEARHVSFGLRWFTPIKEVAICGHATLASASVLFADMAIVPSSVDEIRFSTLSGTMIARRVPGSSRIELTFPVGNIVAADQDTVASVRRLVPKAIKDEDTMINFVGVGSESPYDNYILIDLNLKKDLSTYVVDTRILDEIRGFPVAVLTTRAKDSSDRALKRWKLRVFAASAGIPEDPVTGSANSFAAKYWAQTAGIAEGEEFATEQVSARGGNLGVVWQGEAAKLRGHTRVASRGEIYL